MVDPDFAHRSNGYLSPSSAAVGGLHNAVTSNKLAMIIAATHVDRVAVFRVDGDAVDGKLSPRT